MLQDKWFQAVLTLVAVVVFVLLTVLGKPAEAEVFKTFCIMSFGYWFGQTETIRTIGTKVQEVVNQSVQRVR